MDKAPANTGAISAAVPGKAIYTCPMHPEVQQDHPGNCPKCGMTLVLKTPTAGPDQAEIDELHDMTRRFWISAALTLPVFVLADGSLDPGPGQACGPSAVRSKANWSLVPILHR